MTEYIPPQPPNGAPSPPPPPNYLVFAILVTIFCCLPFGIVAIVFAAQVNAKAAAGDYAGALAASKKAKTWCWVAFILGLIWCIGWTIAAFMGLLSNISFNGSFNF